MTIYELPTPALLIDKTILEKNLFSMQKKANALGVRLRPHIKTHKCLEIAKRQVELGARGITVSTFYEAEQFAAAGYGDITWAFPIPPVYATKVVAFPESISLGVVVDSKEAKGHLDKVCRTAGRKLRVWLKVDCGYHRAGVDPEAEGSLTLARSLADSKVLTFAGILSHSGHAYNARNREEIRPAAEQERDVMVAFAEKLRAHGVKVPSVSIGSTPALSVIEDLKGINEVRPGNYAFYDYTQATIGSCTVADCAVTVLASVISHQPGASHFVTDAGALALSKDRGATQVNEGQGLGALFEDYEKKKLALHIELSSLSQEHGKVTASDPSIIKDKYAIGERVRILEHHSCLAAANFDKYSVVDGEEVVDQWKILRGRA